MSVSIKQHARRVTARAAMKYQPYVCVSKQAHRVYLRRVTMKTTRRPLTPSQHLAIAANHLRLGNRATSRALADAHYAIAARREAMAGRRLDGVVHGEVVS